jgi:hypothetical protein
MANGDIDARNGSDNRAVEIGAGVSPVDLRARTM